MDIPAITKFPAPNMKNWGPNDFGLQFLRFAANPTELRFTSLIVNLEPLKGVDKDHYYEGVYIGSHILFGELTEAVLNVLLSPNEENLREFRGMINPDNENYLKDIGELDNFTDPAIKDIIDLYLRMAHNEPLPPHTIKFISTLQTHMQNLLRVATKLSYA
jgi:hypothetical protein